MEKHVTDVDVQKLMEKLSPDQRAIAQTLAMYKVENAMLKKQNEVLTRDHKELWRILLVLLATAKEEGQAELRIHNSQFMRLDNMWRIERSFDEGTQEVVLKLLTIHDPMPGEHKEAGMIEDDSGDEQVH